MKIDPMYLIIALFLVQIVLFILLINVNMKYNRLKTAYTTFLKGKNGKSMMEELTTHLIHKSNKEVHLFHLPHLLHEA